MDHERQIQNLQQLRWTGAISDEEFDQSEEAILAGDPLEDRVAELLLQEELDQLDRQWESDREQYKIPFKQTRFLPTRGSSLFMGILMTVAGTVWTAGVLSMKGKFGDGFEWWPLIGIAFTLSGLGFSVACYARAAMYEKAYEAYQARRDHVITHYVQGIDEEI